ncbi:MAG TPA: hypothetical protein VJV78_44565 [Polyangiales bacterium]|nr:hypothetical protein [Polyangiales bacterium]
MRRVLPFLSSAACGWAALAIGVALRLAWALIFDPNPVNDGKWYFARSTEIAQGLGYQVSGLPTAYWPVGYPAFLGLVFRLFTPELAAMRMAQVVLAGATLFCIAFVARRLTGSRLAGNLALLLFAFYPTDIAYTSIMLSELSFNTWMMLGFAIGLSAYRWPLRVGAAGVWFALAALTRPLGLLLPAWLGLLGPWTSWRTRIVVTVGVGAALCAALAPWWIRNANAFGAFVPVSNNGGINLFIGNNPRAHGAYRFDGKVERGGRPEYESDQAYGSTAREYIRTNPERTVRLWPRKLQKLLENDVAPIGWSRSMSEDRVAFVNELARPMELYYSALWALALAGLFLGIAGRRAAVPVLHGVLALLTGWKLGFAAWIVVPAALSAELAVFAIRREREFLLRSLCGIPLANLLSVLAITLAFFGDFRFHHAMMPWAAICAGALLAQVGQLLAARSGMVT